MKFFGILTHRAEDVGERALIARLRRDAFHLAADARDLALAQRVDCLRRRRRRRVDVQQVRVDRLAVRDAPDADVDRRGRQVHVREKRTQASQRRQHAAGDPVAHAVAQPRGVGRRNGRRHVRERREERVRFRRDELAVELRGDAFHHDARPEHAPGDRFAQHADRRVDLARPPLDAHRPRFVIVQRRERQVVDDRNVGLDAAALVQREEVRAELEPAHRVAQLLGVEVVVEAAGFRQAGAVDALERGEGRALLRRLGRGRLRRRVVPAVVVRVIAFVRGGFRVAAVVRAPVLGEEPVEPLIGRGRAARSVRRLGRSRRPRASRLGGGEGARGNRGVPEQVGAVHRMRVPPRLARVIPARLPWQVGVARASVSYGR